MTETLKAAGESAALRYETPTVTEIGDARIVIQGGVSWKPDPDGETLLLPGEQMI